MPVPDFQTFMRPILIRLEWHSFPFSVRGTSGIGPDPNQNPKPIAW